METKLRSSDRFIFTVVYPSIHHCPICPIHVVNQSNHFNLSLHCTIFGVKANHVQCSRVFWRTEDVKAPFLDSKLSPTKFNKNEPSYPKSVQEHYVKGKNPLPTFLNGTLLVLHGFNYNIC